MLSCLLTCEERLSPSIEPGRVLVPLFTALRRLNRLGRVRALLPSLRPLPVRHVRSMQLVRGEMLSLSPRKRTPMLTPHRSTRRDVHRQIRSIKHVPSQSFPQIQPVIVPEVSTKRPAILPQEKREA